MTALLFFAINSIIVFLSLYQRWSLNLAVLRPVVTTKKQSWSVGLVMCLNTLGLGLGTNVWVMVTETLLKCLSVSSSSSINKHWEAELAALKGNNAKLTAALLESTANVKQWKQQLAAYQEEAERLHTRVRLTNFIKV